MRNPTRRSRNIGTAKQGHGQNNRLVLPTPFYFTPSQCSHTWFYENLRDFHSETRFIAEHKLIFLTEKPRPSVAHACSIDDIVRILSCVPPVHLQGLELIVLRQPKRKEEILSPVWGRYIPVIDIQKFSGSAIILESLDLRRPIKWEKPLNSYALERMKRLRLQGHTVIETHRFFEISSTLEAVRETQLYETLPHEVGHHVHASTDEHFSHRTTREKEAFAERYQREFIEKFGAALQQSEVRPLVES